MTGPRKLAGRGSTSSVVISRRSSRIGTSDMRSEILRYEVMRPHRSFGGMRSMSRTYFESTPAIQQLGKSNLTAPRSMTRIRYPGLAFHPLADSVSTTNAFITTDVARDPPQGNANGPRSDLNFGTPRNSSLTWVRSRSRSLHADFAEEPLFDHANTFDLTFGWKTFVEAFITKFVLEIGPRGDQLLEDAW